MASNGPPYDDGRRFGEYYRAADMIRPLQMRANPTALPYPGHRSSAFNGGRYNTTNPDTFNTSSGFGASANLGCTTGNPYITHGTSKNFIGLNDVPIRPNHYGGHGPYPAPTPSTGFNHPHDYTSSVSNVDAPCYLNDSGSMLYRHNASYQSMSSGPTAPTDPGGFGSWTTNTQPNSNLINAHPDQPSYPVYPKHVSAPSRSSDMNVPTGSVSSFSSDNTTAQNVNSAPTRRYRPMQPSTSNGYGRSNGLKRSIDSDHDQPETSGRARRLDGPVGLGDHTRHRNIAQLPGRDAHPRGPSSTDLRSAEAGMPSIHHNIPGPSTRFGDRRTASLPVRTVHVDVRIPDDPASTAVATRNNSVELDLPLDLPQLLPCDVDPSGASGFAEFNAVDDGPSSNVDIGGHAVDDVRPTPEAALDLPSEEAWFDTWYHAEGKYLLTGKPGGSTSDPICPDANAPDSVLGVVNAKLDEGIEVDGPDTDHDSRMELSLSGLPQYMIELDALGRSDSMPGNQVLYNSDGDVANDTVSSSTHQSYAAPHVSSPSGAERQVPTLVHIASDTPSIAAIGSSSDQIADLPDNLRGLVDYYRIRPNISADVPLLDNNENRSYNVSTTSQPSPVAWGTHHNNSPHLGEYTPYDPAYSYRHLPLGTCPTTTPLVTPTLLQPTPNRYPALRQLNLHLASSVERGGQANHDGGFDSSASYQHDQNNVGQRQPDSLARPLGIHENPRTLERSRSPGKSHSEPTRSVGHADSAHRPPMPQPAAQVSDTPIRTKRIYMVRSGEGEHIARGDNSILDPPLTARGVHQCQVLNAQTIDTIQKTAELVLISPLRRAVETATTAFPALLSRLHHYRLAQDPRPTRQNARVVAALQELGGDLSSMPGPTTGQLRPAFMQTTLSETSRLYVGLSVVESRRKLGYQRWALWRAEENHIVIISHVNCLRALLKESLGRSAQWTMDNGTVRVFDLTQTPKGRLLFREIDMSDAFPSSTTEP